MNAQTKQLKIKCIAQVRCVTVFQAEFETEPGEPRAQVKQHAIEIAETEFPADSYEVEALEFDYALQDSEPRERQ